MNLKNEKIALKQLYEHTLRDREQVQQQWSDYTTSEDEEYTRFVRHIIFINQFCSHRRDSLQRKRDCLNEEIHTLNENVAAVRKKEDLLKVKETSLAQLEKAIERFHNDEISSGEEKLIQC